MARTSALSYCAEEVRRHDYDRFLTALCAPGERREALFALYAFNAEISKTRDVVSETMLGAIRLQWWRESVETLFSDGPLRKHAVMEALALAHQERAFSHSYFEEMIDARLQDLEETPPPSLNDLEKYADGTSGALVVLAMEALGGAPDAAVAAAGRKVGIAWALIGLLRSLPHRLQKGRTILPSALLMKHGVDRKELLNLRPSPELQNAVAEIAGLARSNLSAARAMRSEIPKVYIAALLPAVLAETYLARLTRLNHNVFDSRLGASLGIATARLAYRALIGRY